MLHNFSRLLAALLVLLGGALIQAQETAPAPGTHTTPPSKPQFFSGTVTTVDKEHITVSRSLVGKATETRTFLIKPTTKVARSVKVKTKVTVRYRHESEDGDVALEIQLRSNWPFSRS